MATSRIIKIIAIICFGLLAAVIIIARNSPTTGYEMSIYTATPTVLWVIVSSSIICGIGIILHQIWNRKENESRLWQIGLLLVALSFIVLLSVYVFRGYPYYGRGDSTTHLAVVNRLISEGHTGRQNFYPITHIYIVQLSQVCNITPMKLLNFLPVLFNVLYIGFIYLFSQFLLHRKSQVVLATVAGIFLLSSLGYGSVYADPNQLADLMIPFAFFLCIRQCQANAPYKAQFTVLFLLVLFVLPLIHIVPAFALWLMAVSLWPSVRLYNWATKNQPSSEYRFMTGAVLFLLVWGITWISSFYIWDMMVRNVKFVITEGGETWAKQLGDQMLLASQYGYSVTEQFFKAYYEPLVYGVIALASLPILLRKLPKDMNLQKLLSLYGPLAAYTLATVLFFVLNIGFGPGRMIRYALIVCIPSVGFLVYEILQRAQNTSGRNLLPKVLFSLVIIVLILIPMNGVLKAYPSPYRLIPNDQPTLSEPDGFEWLGNYGDVTLGLTTLTLPVDRLATLLPAPGWTSKHISLIPWHFNYTERNLLGESYNENWYMLLNRQDRLQYTQLFPEIAKYRFYPGDFARLESDHSLDKIYLNGGIDIWYIHPRAQAP